MNLFQKKGIKEVADVTFYSINTIGDEEFYTPVLVLDTLKVSTYEKVAEKVSSTGGKGNKKLITWNFGKEITLNLEDALFSPASMSMIWGGLLQSKLSDYTSSIVKGSIANKYGKLHYSTRAYPSPALTDAEWDIVFSTAERFGLDSLTSNDNPYVYVDDSTNSEYVSENRENFFKNYFRRTWKEVSLNTSNIYNFFGDWSTTEPWVKLSTESITNYCPTRMVITGLEDVEFTGDSGTIVLDGGANATSGPVKIYYKSGVLLSNPKVWGEENPEPLSADITIPYKKDSDGNVWADGEIVLTRHEAAGSSTNVWNRMFGDYNGTVTCISAQDFLNVLFPDVTDKNILLNLAMPEVILQGIKTQLNSLKKIGTIETDFNETEVIDRMEKCIVKNRDGLTISTNKQKENLFKYYMGNKEETYTIYYDAKTMLPLFRIEGDGIIDSANDLFKIKIGTTYYKWTRTVKRKESSDDGTLGTTLVIDAETFPGDYRVVGETYIRDQKTGKDKRCQLTIFKANVSSDTNITLEAAGDPTTFSMSLDVLTPPNDIMMDIKEYDVEDDVIEGGTRILPQSNKYTYTPTSLEYLETVDTTNDEMY